MLSPRLHYPLGIGEIIIVGEDAVISTVLGSCVSICLYSVDGSIGGMNHFVLPGPGGDAREEEEAYRYGDASCKVLIETLLKKAADKGLLVAKIIGGASILNSKGLSRDIGQANAKMARSILERYRIPIIGEDLGGEFGRKVFFYTSSGRVRVHKFLPEGKASVTTPVLRKTRVLIVDDSKTVQEFLKKIFADDPEMEVVGVANQPSEAEAILASASTRVDVMTLDIQMPGMDGITFLEQLMPRKPMPVVMLTSMRMEDGDQVLRALELGAVDYIQKPKLQDISTVGPLICTKIKAAARAQVHRQRPSRPRIARTKTSQRRLSISRGKPFVAIGASTGGTVALTQLLTALPNEIPPIVIVQHIPAGFSRAFAERVNTLCAFEVKEAEDGDELCSNRVLIAPGGRQMQIEHRGGRLRVKISDGEPVNRHKPSVDYLFNSIAEESPGQALGIILTGMGDDGARGLLAIRRTQSYTIAQDEASSVVYGMPKEAVRLGAVARSASLDQIPSLIEAWMREHKVSA
jgi:two-component system chemotaxis response regulator CheB